MWRLPSADWRIAAALFAGATLVGSFYVRAFDRTGARVPTDLRTLPSRSMWYGQSDFGAAVALACGRGYVDPPDALTPGLTRFLSVQTDRFSCAELPASLPPRNLRITQRLYPYLLSAVAGVWAVRGVSWSGLWPLFGLLYGMTVPVCYGLFRLGMGRVAASVAAIAIMISPIHLGNLPGLRDYAKAPFILGLILIAATVVSRLDRTRPLLALSAAFGALLGAGFGFRNDIVIVVPLILVALLAWDPPRDARAVGMRLAAIAIAAATFVVVAFPILSGYTRGSNSGHVALLGFMAPFDRPLGIAPSVYEWGYVYSDGFGDAMLKSFSSRVHHQSLSYFSREYDAAAFAYIRQIARHWPADVLTRAYAAVLRIADMPFTPGTHADEIPFGIQNGVLTRLFNGYNAVVNLLRGQGVIAVALFLLLVSRWSVWRAALLLAALIYLAGYPALQFQPRHFFHLEFIPWLALGVLGERAGAYVRARFGGVRRAPMSRLAAQQMAVFALVGLTILALPLAAARMYQQRHVRALMQGYVDAPRDRLPVESVETGTRTLLRTVTLWSDRDPRMDVNTQYVVARFSPATCPVVRLPVTFRYTVLEGQPDFSMESVITFLPPSPVEIFFPAYDVAGKSRFDGVELSRGFERCVEEVTRVRNLDPLPMLVNLTLTPGWQQSALYQRLAEWEVPDRTPLPSLYTLPPTLTVAVRATQDSAIAAPSLWRRPMVHGDSPREWRISGTPRSAEWPLLELAPQLTTTADRFVLEGEVVRGGITIGLVRDHKWTEEGHVTIAKAGQFLAVLAPSAPGEYGVLFASGPADSTFLRHAPEPVVQLAGWFHDFSDVRISKAGWSRLE
jgi:hypothetical protein